MAEEPFDDSQEERLHASRQLRQLRIEADRAAEIERLRLHDKPSPHVHTRTRHRKRHVREVNRTVADLERAPEV